MDDSSLPDNNEDPVSSLDGVVMLMLPLSCCLLPLGLTGLSLASAWASAFTTFNAYRPWVLGVALIAVFVG